MAPHSVIATGSGDEIEIEHVDNMNKAIVSVRSSRNTSRVLSHTNSLLCTMSGDSADDAGADDLDDTVLLQNGSADSADEDTIYDTFNSICLPLCAPGCLLPRKSALKKPRAYPSGFSPPKRNVSFNSLTVREYDLTLGDHPSSASGPPVQLDWEHKHESVVDLDKYEEERQPRKTRRQLKMTFQEREQILQNKGYSMEELKNAWMASLKIRQQRYETIMTGSLTTKMEEAWESACRKFNRFFTLTQDMEGYEVKAESEGSRESYAYVKSDEDEPHPSGIEGNNNNNNNSSSTNNNSAGTTSHKWSLFESCTGTRLA